MTSIYTGLYRGLEGRIYSSSPVLAPPRLPISEANSRSPPNPCSELMRLSGSPDLVIPPCSEGLYTSSGCVWPPLAPASEARARSPPKPIDPGLLGVSNFSIDTLERSQGEAYRARSSGACPADRPRGGHRARKLVNGGQKKKKKKTVVSGASIPERIQMYSRL